jgi:hypothetical protein
MVWSFLVCQTGGATDATAQKVIAHSLSTVAMAKMALPGLLLHIKNDHRRLGWQ